MKRLSVFNLPMTHYKVILSILLTWPCVTLCRPGPYNEALDLGLMEKLGFAGFSGSCIWYVLFCMFIIRSIARAGTNEFIAQKFACLTIQPQPCSLLKQMRMDSCPWIVVHVPRIGSFPWIVFMSMDSFCVLDSFSIHGFSFPRVAFRVFERWFIS